jgi:mono/diheme cytochrome c family protein
MRWRKLFTLSALVFLATVRPAGAGDKLGIGAPVTAPELELWNIDIASSGAGLPPGRGGVAEGRRVYMQVCASCHGPSGTEGPMDKLAGGRGTLDSAKPVKTVGSFWPYATTLFDYVRRAMPFTQPQSLSNEQVYAVTAYLLHLNGILAEDAWLDAASLPKVQMPNRGGFSPDPRPDVP